MTRTRTWPQRSWPRVNEVVTAPCSDGTFRDRHVTQLAAPLLCCSSAAECKCMTWHEICIHSSIVWLITKDRTIGVLKSGRCPKLAEHEWPHSVTNDRGTSCIHWPLVACDARGGGVSVPINGEQTADSSERWVNGGWPYDYLHMLPTTYSVIITRVILIE